MLKRALLPLALLALTACAGPQAPDIELAPQIDAQRYRSFDIEPQRIAGHRIDLESRFDQALNKALTEKGYTPTAQGDLQVLYALGLERSSGLELQPVQVAGGTYTRTINTSSDQALLVLRIIDRQTKAVLYQAKIDKTLTNPDLSQERFNQAVSRFLADFPARH